jgi:serine/threonine protein kinase
MSGTSWNDTADPPRIPGLELQEKIGEGGASVVYRAVHRNLQRTVAVKVLRAPTDEDGGHPAWLREPQLMASLGHPHVVTIHDAGQVSGHNYLVMEYVSGGALRSRMRPGSPWPLDEATRLLDDVAQALAHIHGQGILHLDLKPDNVLYTADGRIKITDFGLSVPHTDANALLGGGRYCGTLDYCAPEYRSGLALDARADVFSLAAVAYELLTGRPPGRVYVPASRRNPRLPAALDDVLRRGLSRDPDQRYASVEQFRRVLIGAGRATEPRAPRRLGALVALVVLLGVALAVSKWWPAAQQPIGPPAPEGSDSQSQSERPERLLVLYDKPDDLSLLTGESGGELTSGSAVPVERVLVENPPLDLPPGIPLPVWPTPRPTLVIRSPHAWGFVYPLRDRALAQRVVNNWSDLLRTVVPDGSNLVKAGGFDGDCLAKDHRGALWRTGGATGWSATRQITLDRPRDRPDNPALLLTNLDPSRSEKLLGCYQPMAQGPPPGAVVVLRYRARSLRGKGSLAVYAGMPVVIPEAETGPAAGRIRRLGSALPPDDPVPGQWLYRCPNWVTPTDQWLTYLVVCESPPFPTRRLHRNLVIDLAATPQAATDQVWVDDVELFVWRPESQP